MLECIARLFSGYLCAGRIPGKALHESKIPPDLRPYRQSGRKMELSQSGLQQSNGLTVIAFKSQLRDLGFEGIPRRSLLVYSG